VDSGGQHVQRLQVGERANSPRRGAGKSSGRRRGTARAPPSRWWAAPQPGSRAEPRVRLITDGNGVSFSVTAFERTPISPPAYSGTLHFTSTDSAGTAVGSQTGIAVSASTTVAFRSRITVQQQR
jgi:hypothetical protein